jgi:hypothetical protein
VREFRFPRGREFGFAVFSITKLVFLWWLPWRPQFEFMPSSLQCMSVSCLIPKLILIVGCPWQCQTWFEPRTLSSQPGQTDLICLAYHLTIAPFPWLSALQETGRRRCYFADSDLLLSVFGATGRRKCSGQFSSSCLPHDFFPLLSHTCVLGSRVPNPMAAPDTNWRWRNCATSKHNIASRSHSCLAPRILCCSVKCVTTDWMNGVRFPAETKGFFPQAFLSRPALRHTQSLIQWVPGSFPGGKTRPGRDADHSPHLVPRLRMSRSYISSPLLFLHDE